MTYSKGNKSFCKSTLYENNINIDITHNNFFHKHNILFSMTLRSVALFGHSNQQMRVNTNAFVKRKVYSLSSQLVFFTHKPD